MITIHPAFASHTIEYFGERGETWLRELPAQVTDLSRQWDFSIGEPYSLSYDYVIAVQQSDGTAKSSTSGSFSGILENLRKSRCALNQSVPGPLALDRRHSHLWYTGSHPPMYTHQKVPAHGAIAMRMTAFLRATSTALLLTFSISSGVALAGGTEAAHDCVLNTRNRPICPAGASPDHASFIDPTVRLGGSGARLLGNESYLGPFVEILTEGDVYIGSKSNLQDNVRLGGNGTIVLGDEVILAHGARVKGPARIGKLGGTDAHKATFVGFNSQVDGASMESDSMVLHLARVAPGITIPHSMVVISGKNITTQAQANDPALGKVMPITEGLREFMHGVLHVNETFAREYARLALEDVSNLTGVNYDPGDGGVLKGSFNPKRDLPSFAGKDTRDPNQRNRVIGRVTLADSLVRFSEIAGSAISLRADEGEPFSIGVIKMMQNHVTFHALEHTGIDVGQQVSFRLRGLVHGGESVATKGNPHANTKIGDGTEVGELAVVFRSSVGNNVTIGCASLLDGATIAAGSTIPPRTVMVNTGSAGAMTYPVEWDPGCGGVDD